LLEPGGLDLLLGGVGAALLAEADDGGDEAAVVLHALVGAVAGASSSCPARPPWASAPDLTRTGQRSVNLTCREPNLRTAIRNHKRQ
jgi:hypothetical protein